MTPTVPARVVLLAGFAGALAMQIPVANLAERLTGNTGGLLFLMPLVAYKIIECIGPAAQHHGLVWGTALVLYLGLYSLAALPTHLAFRSSARAHPIAIGIVTLLFIATMAFAFPVGGLPL